jgi:hypothetical protein
MRGQLVSIAGLVEQAIYNDPPHEIRDICRENYRPYYHLLHLLAMEVGYLLPEGICVELGVEKGRGSYAMALAGVEVWGMDHTRRGELSVLEAKFPHFHYLEQPSLPVPKAIEQQGRRIVVLHVDTEHSFAQAREEYRFYKHLLADTAVVLFDDTHAQESAVGHFVASVGRPTIFDDRLHECGYAVMLFSRDQEDGVV